MARWVFRATGLTANTTYRVDSAATGDPEGQPGLLGSWIRSDGSGALPTFVAPFQTVYARVVSAAGLVSGGATTLTGVYDADEPYNPIPDGTVGTADLAPSVRELLPVALPAVPLITYGTSAVAESVDSVGGDRTLYYTQRVADRLGLTYPGASGEYRRGVGGALAYDVCHRLIGTAAPWVGGTKAVALLECLGNTYRNVGAGSTTSNKTATSAMRAMCAAISSTRIEHSDAMFTYSGTWSQSSSSANSSGGLRGACTANAGYVQFTAPKRRAWILSIGTSGTDNPTVTFTDQTASTTLATVDLGGHSTTVPYAWEIPASARGHVVRMTRTSSTSFAMYFDCLLTQDVHPVPIVLVNEPYKNDYSISVEFPNGSDAACDEYNAINAVMAGEFANVINVKPNLGYWNAAAMTWTDGVHVNATGQAAVADAVVDAVRAALAARGGQISRALA